MGVYVHPVPSRQRFPGKPTGRSVFIGVGALCILALLLAAPVTSATSAGVTVKRPFTGTVVAGQAGSFSGIGCPGTGNLSFTPPYFSLKNGNGGVGEQSNSQPCKSWVDEYHQEDTESGLITSAFSPGKKYVNDPVKFRWTLTYSLLVNTTWGGGNETSYAYAAVYLEASVIDVTTGGGTGSQTAFYNFTYLLDHAGQIFYDPYKVQVTMVVTLTLHASDKYELETYVGTETRAEADGPVGSHNDALAQAGFPGTGPKADLDSISY
jgi:hypothetical protein